MHNPLIFPTGSLDEKRVLSALHRYLHLPMAACEVVYYAAHRSGVAGQEVSAKQKDFMHDGDGGGSAAHVEHAWPFSRHMCGALGVTGYAISSGWPEAGIDGCWRITKIEDMNAGSFLEGKLLWPRAD